MEQVKVNIKNELAKSTVMPGMKVCLTGDLQQIPLQMCIRDRDKTKQEESVQEPEKKEDSGKEPDVSEEDAAPQQICVFLCGAVNQPGVYYLKEGARLYEGIAACLLYTS